MNLHSLNRTEMNEKISDAQIQASLQMINEEHLPFYFKRLLVNTEKHNFFTEAIMTTNLLEMIVEMIGFFTSSVHIKCYVIHLIDKFYRQHLAKVTDEYRTLKSREEKLNNSWPAILYRLRRQTPFRLVTCIFIAIKYNYQHNGLKMDDYLFVLSKYDYECSEERFLRSQNRVLSEIEYDLNIVTLLDVVLFLQTLLKFNIELETEFFFSHIYDLIDLIYDTELRANQEDHSNAARDTARELLYGRISRTFKLYACLVLCLVPLLINHSQTKQVNNQLNAQWILLSTINLFLNFTELHTLSSYTLRMLSI